MKCQTSDNFHIFLEGSGNDLGKVIKSEAGFLRNCYKSPSEGTETDSQRFIYFFSFNFLRIITFSEQIAKLTEK